MGVMMHVLFVFFYLIIFDVRPLKSPFGDAACRAGRMHLHAVDNGDPGHLCTVTHYSWSTLCTMVHNVLLVLHNRAAKPPHAFLYLTWCGCKLTCYSRLLKHIVLCQELGTALPAVMLCLFHFDALTRFQLLTWFTASCEVVSHYQSLACPISTWLAAMQMTSLLSAVPCCHRLMSTRSGSASRQSSWLLSLSLATLCATCMRA